MNLKIKSLLAIVALVAVTYPAMSDGNTSSSKNLILTKDNLVILNSEINGESVAKTSSELLRLDRKASAFGKQEPIYLYLYSPGGSIQDGLELFETTKGMKRPVSTVTMFAASMAFQLVQNLGDRLILNNGTLMSHRAAGGFEGSFGGQAPSQLDKRYSFWLQRLKEMDQQTVDRTNGKQTMESYLAQYANEMWITGQQSVKQGYADSIVTLSCDKSLDGNDSHTANIMGMKVTYETPKCPLITGLLNIKVESGDGKTAVNPMLEETVKAKLISSFDFLGMVK